MSSDSKLQPSTKLSSELANRSSGLNVIVDLASLASEKGSIGAKPMVNRARKLIHQACSLYVPCQCGQACCLCRSGENGKPAFRGAACRGCTMSQISPTGVFVGTILRDKTKI